MSLLQLKASRFLDWILTEEGSKERTYESSESWGCLWLEGVGGSRADCV